MVLTYVNMDEYMEAGRTPRVPASNVQGTFQPALQLYSHPTRLAALQATLRAFQVPYEPCRTLTQGQGGGCKKCGAHGSRQRYKHQHGMKVHGIQDMASLPQNMGGMQCS
jgi:hypothetical protein